MNARDVFPPGAWVLVALSLSIGWGIRGNFGHEFGAMIPGALAALAAVLVAGREDWWKRSHFFAFFGALGWSFGGSISYMQVIGYTHSGDSLSVWYGFACLFVIGFLWGAMGGAGTALPARLTREQLTEFFAPLTAVFLAWWAQDIFEQWFDRMNSDYRHTSPLYWYDTDWLAALTGPVAILLLGAIRRRWDAASSLILYMAIGWWIGFLLLVNVLGLRMTPPRGDSWAGCLGMTAGLMVFLWRQGWHEVLWATLIAGLVGGFGFASAALIKLLGMTSGWQTNWHSVLEQTYGLVNGLGIAAAVAFLIRRAPVLDDAARRRPWTDIYAVVFVLIGITYLNLRKNPSDWVKAKAFPVEMYGLATGTWFALAYLALATVLVALLVRHRREPLALLPVSALGRAQLLYLVFLWWVVVGNFERVVVAFAPQRLVTEGVIYLNAVICTGLVLWQGRAAVAPMRVPVNWSLILRRTFAFGSLAAVLSVTADWALIRAIYGDRFAGQAALHIRFGPNATATKEKPKAGQAHP